MSCLACAWLARQSNDGILGLPFGDLVHGPLALLDWPESVRSEIRLHRLSLHGDRLVAGLEVLHPRRISLDAAFETSIPEFAAAAAASTIQRQQNCERWPVRPSRALAYPLLWP